MLNLCKYGNVDGVVGNSQLTYSMWRRDCSSNADAIVLSDGTVWKVDPEADLHVGWGILGYTLAVQKAADGLIYFQYDLDYHYDPMDCSYDRESPFFRGPPPEGPSEWFPLKDYTFRIVQIQYVFRRFLNKCIRTPEIQHLGLAALTHPRVNPGSNACFFCNDIKRLVATRFAKWRRMTPARSTKDLALNRNGTLFLAFSLISHPRLGYGSGIECYLNEDIMQTIAAQM